MGFRFVQREKASTTSYQRLVVGVVYGCLALLFLSGINCTASQSVKEKAMAPKSPSPSQGKGKETGSETRKIHANLLQLDQQVRTGGRSLNEAASDMAIQMVGNGIQLDIVTNTLDEAVAKKFDRPGVIVKHMSRQYRRLSVVIEDTALLHELAKIPEVQMIQPEYGGTTGGRVAPTGQSISR